MAVQADGGDAFLVIPSLVFCQRGFAAVPSGTEGFSQYPVTLGTGDLTGSAGFALKGFNLSISCLCVSPANSKAEEKMPLNLCGSSFLVEPGGDTPLPWHCQ